MIHTTFLEIVRHKHIKQSGLAADLGLSRARFAQKVFGYRGSNFTPEERAKLAEAMGLPVGHLFPDTVEDKVRA